MLDKAWLENLYNRFNHRSFVHPDPLEFLYDYRDTGDREIAGLIASSLAYGRVTQILKSVGWVLEKTGKNPRDYLLNSVDSDIISDTRGFKHRFTTDDELASFLIGIRTVLKKYGSLGSCFKGCYVDDNTVLPTLLAFIKELRSGDCKSYNSLLPKPDGKCAYKRLNLYLRWMIRRDNVDPGGWDGLCPSMLIIPLDIHMYNISVYHELTSRKQADMKTALEVTASFRKIEPEDPVKYDFALTRENIQKNN